MFDESEEEAGPLQHAHELDAFLVSKASDHVDIHEDEDADLAWLLPPPATPLQHRPHSTPAKASDPLTKKKRVSRRWNLPQVLFGEASTLQSQRRKRASPKTSSSSLGIAGFFLGFLYEDEDPNETLLTSHSTVIPQRIKSLHFALFVALMLSSAATAVPITLLPVLSQTESEDFSSRAAASSVLGTAFGKFINGPMGDIWGVRFTSTVYASLLSGTLLLWSLVPNYTVWACFWVEFFQAVQWPCTIVVLATHQDHYEQGIYTTSLALRCGSLIGIPLWTWTLRHCSCRVVAALGAWAALVSASVSYLFVWDSPSRRDDPQNPYKGSLLLHSNLIPSLKLVLGSATFWIVALAHTGSSMVRSCDKILGTYFVDTSGRGASGWTVVLLSLGIVIGLGVGGRLFSVGNERARKRLLTRLYTITILSCYGLAILAIPRFHGLWLGQLVLTLIMGFGIAVPAYHVPSLVSTLYGTHKGLYAAYTDGVAYGLSAWVWRIVGNAVMGNANGAGWAYGWAAVALLLILSAIVMVEFWEHYFCQGRRGPLQDGNRRLGYETIIFA